ncbi:unnamed protein product [Meloidogyne enterolobii]|uniref:Uncharacterized protein n=1 Tax=Meloidogyne enterolobii TaxID=390850 RepID=A0ACB1A1N5_MELEN
MFYGVFTRDGFFSASVFPLLPSFFGSSVFRFFMFFRLLLFKIQNYSSLVHP